MLASQRRTAITAELARSGAVRVAELVARFGVTDMTIRRDLEVLEGVGRLRRVHGGAVAAGSSADEPGFDVKAAVNREAKRAIARRAAELVRPGAAIAISAGTTTSILAEELCTGPTPLSVVTNSTTVADVFAAAAVDGLSVILTGGLRTPSAALVGAVADRSIADLHVDQLFLGVHGMDAAGLTTPNLAEAQTNAALIRQATSVIVVADSSKWGVLGLAKIAPLQTVDILITDDALPDDARLVLAGTVGDLMIVPAP